MKPSYDAVVIGSGFGGAIAACRLAEAGQAVCLLERGPWRQKTDFPRSPHELATNALWDETSGQGFIEYRSFPYMDVVQGCGVGGGSLHYFNVCKQPPAAILDNPRWPAGINLQRLALYYTLERQMLAARPLVPPAGRMLPARTRAFLEALTAYGARPELVDIAVNSQDALPPQPFQIGCTYCGNCLIGCNVHAKNTLDLNYIRVAQDNGADVYALHRVENIEPQGKGYKIYIRRAVPGRDMGCETVTVTAAKVIVAAGTLGSTELLLKCRDVHKSLPRLGPALGKGFSGNGDYLLAGTQYANKAIDPSSGPSITAAASFAEDGQQICIEDLGFPDPLLWYINGSVPTSERIGDLFAFAASYLRSSLGLSYQSRMDLEIDRLFQGGITTGFLPYLGMGTDAGDGELHLGPDGHVAIHWRPDASMPMFHMMERYLREISQASGGTYVESFLWTWPFRKLLTAHPLGGCAMSSNAERGVVNELGEVWRYPNLYVADGSIVPTAVSVNPSATISALAERIAFHIIHGREMEERDMGALASAAGAGSR